MAEQSEEARAGSSANVGTSAPGETPAPDIARIQRKLLMGVALILALGSVYAGLFDARLIQIVFAAAATIVLVSALTRRPQR